MEIPPGKLRFLWSTNQNVPNVSSEEDIEQYRKDRTHPFFEGSRRNCPDIGSTACILSLKPGVDSPMHRTATLDVIFVLSGVVEMMLDSGEKQQLRAGDSIVERGTIHAWKNVSPYDQWATMIAFIQPVEDPIKVGGKSLTSDWAR